MVKILDFSLFFGRFSLFFFFVYLPTSRSFHFLSLSLLFFPSISPNDSRWKGISTIWTSHFYFETPRSTFSPDPLVPRQPPQQPPHHPPGAPGGPRLRRPPCGPALQQPPTAAAATQPQCPPSQRLQPAAPAGSVIRGGAAAAVGRVVRGSAAQCQWTDWSLQLSAAATVQSTAAAALATASNKG